MEKAQQINALLFGHPTHENKAGNIQDITFNEIIEYVKKNGLNPPHSYNRNSLSDGFKFYEEDGIWYCACQERGRIYEERTFANYNEGLEYIVKILLKLSGFDIR